MIGAEDETQAADPAPPAPTAPGPKAPGPTAPGPKAPALKATASKHTAGGRTAAWARRTSDKVPTAWAGAIGTGVFLALTAAFGGLDTVEPPPVAEIAVGADYSNTQLRVNIQRAVLIDDLTEAMVYPPEGQRLLVIVVDVENLWDGALAIDQGLRPTLVPADSADLVDVAGKTSAENATLPADVVLRSDDGTQNPVLQPGTTAPVWMAWYVDPDRLAGGASVDFEIRDQSLRTGSFLLSGEYWSGDEVAGRITLTLEDLGAGADS